jgi:hypothetical protein
LQVALGQFWGRDRFAVCDQKAGEEVVNGRLHTPDKVRVSMSKLRLPATSKMSNTRWRVFTAWSLRVFDHLMVTLFKSSPNSTYLNHFLTAQRRTRAVEENYAAKDEPTLKGPH